MASLISNTVASCSPMAASSLPFINKGQFAQIPGDSSCRQVIDLPKRRRNLGLVANSFAGGGGASVNFDVPFPTDYSELLSQGIRAGAQKKRREEVKEAKMEAETEDMAREENDEQKDLLRDRLRLSAIPIAESQAKNCGMDISDTVVACISDLAFKYSEQLAKDLELFAQHGGRKTVNMEDVILSAHRNEHLGMSLRSISNDLKARDLQSDKKRKKAAVRKEDKGTPS